MLIAFLIAIGVDLIVIVMFVTVVVGRRRWLKRQPGAFIGMIRVVTGEADSLGPKWKRGSGRWVRDVLVWSRAPFMYRNVLIPVDEIAAARRAGAGEVKRLGDDPTVIEFVSGETTIETATARASEGLAMGPFSPPLDPAGASRDG